MGLIDLVFDFCEGYSFAHKNLERSIREGKPNIHVRQFYETAEQLNNNPASAAGSLTALLFNPLKTAKNFKNQVYSVLSDEMELFKELKKYMKLRY